MIVRFAMPLVSVPALLLLACGPATTPPPANPGPAPAAPAAAAPAPDGAVKEGAGWKRTAPGTWTFALDADRGPDMGLTAFGVGQGVARITLPAGAKRARVAALRVAYVEAGKGLWTLVKDEGGSPGEQALATLPIAITAADLTPQLKPPQWIDHPLVGAKVVVEGTFYALFSSNDSPRPAVAGLRNKAEGARLFYRGSPRSRLQRVEHHPLVRVVLADVE